MKSTRYSRKKRKQRLILRRTIFITSILVIVGLIVTLGWFIVGKLPGVVAAGDHNVSSPTTTTTTIPTSTTTRGTIAINAPLSTPRVVLYDVTHSSLLYTSGADEQCYPASLTKLLTAIVVSDHCTPDEQFTVGSELKLVAADASTAQLKAGYVLTRDMIVDAMLLPSGNDAAYTIAAHVGRKVSGDATLSDIEAVRYFAKLMNETALEVGASNSHFSNPDGYFSADHYTTARDIMKIALHAMDYDNLRASVAKAAVTYTLISGETLALKNTNEMINPASAYYFNGANGMKTGFTNEAGYCVVVTAKRGDTELMAVVMGGLTNDTRWQDALSVLSQGFAAEGSDK